MTQLPAEIHIELHCVQKKTPTCIFCYISVKKCFIYTEFSEYVCEDLGIPTKSNLNIHCYCWLANIL